MRKLVTNLTFNNFGFKPGSEENLSSAQILVQNNQLNFIEIEKTNIYSILREITKNITYANKVYPTCMPEYMERRLNQDKAIAACFDLLAELNFCAELLPNLNMDSILIYVQSIELEIKLLKAWKKSDNKIKNSLMTIEKHNDETFENNN